MSLNYVLLGERIKALRNRRGLSQQTLAETVDCATNYISYIENAERCMSLPFFVKVANALQTSSDELLQDSLSNTLVTSNHAFSVLLTDCSEYEIRIMFEVAKAAKEALRKNRSRLRNDRR